MWCWWMRSEVMYTEAMLNAYRDGTPAQDIVDAIRIIFNK